jgi:hypothetical protein
MAWYQPPTDEAVDAAVDAGGEPRDPYFDAMAGVTLTRATVRMVVAANDATDATDGTNEAFHEGNPLDGTDLVVDWGYAADPSGAQDTFGPVRGRPVDNGWELITTMLVQGSLDEVRALFNDWVVEWDVQAEEPFEMPKGYGEGSF